MNCGFRAGGGLFAGCLALLLAAGGAHAQGVGLFLWADPPGVTTGDSLSVQLRVLDPGAKFNGFGVTIQYDPAALQYVPRARSTEEGVSMRSACGNTFYRNAAQADGVQVDDVLLCNQVSLTGPATLLDLRFVAIGGEQVTWVRLTSAAVYDDGLYVTPLVTHDARIPIITTLGVPPHAGANGGMRLTASPNPARGAVSFALDGARSDAGEVVVCDLSGRVVSRVALSPGAGRGVATWSGRGDDGRDLPAGVYTALVRTPGGTAHTRFVRLH